MSNEIHQHAKQVGSHRLAVTKLNSFHSVAKHPHGNFLVPREFNVQNKHKVVVRQAPQSSITSSSWLNGAITDFKLERCSLSVLTNAYILVKITNSTSASTTLAPTPFWVDQIEIFNVQGNALSSITGQQLFLTLAFLSWNEFEQLASYICLSTAYATMGTAVADATSGVFYIPLFHLFGSTKLHLNGLSEEITVRVKTNVTYLVRKSSHRYRSCINSERLQRAKHPLGSPQSSLQQQDGAQTAILQLASG
jgi:hypothetical protein